MKKFKEYTDEMNQTTNMRVESVGKLTDPSNPALGRMRLPSLNFHPAGGSIAKVMDDKI